MSSRLSKEAVSRRPLEAGVLALIRRDRVLWVLILLQVVAGIPYLYPSLLDEGVASDYTDAFIDVIIGSIAIAAYALGYRVRESSREQRLFRWAIVLGLLVWVLAKFFMGMAPDEYTSSVFGNAVFDGCLVVGMALFLVGAEMQPDREAGWTIGNRPFQIRMLAVLCAVICLYTYFTLAPWLGGLPESDGWGRSLFLFIPFDAFLVLRFSWLRGFSNSPRWRSIYGWLAIAGMLLLCVDIVEFMAQEEWIPWIGLEPMGLIWFLPYIVFTLVGRLIATGPDEVTPTSQDQTSQHDFANAEIVIIGLLLAILAIHFVGPWTEVLSPDLAPVRNLIALGSMCLLGAISLIQAFILGRHSRRLSRELRAINEQLLQSQKMEAVGQLAGGMAHDFNNILAVVVGNEELLRERLRDDEDGLSFAVAIREACERADALTSQLLAFSKDHVQPPTSLDLAVIIHGMMGMMQRLMGAQVDLKIVEHADSLWISANQSQIEQVLMNLCVNARDAMPDGGALIIELSQKDRGDEAVDRAADGTATHAVITVSDTGCGMTETVMDRIFEPFYSTKPRHLGTGLGLSTVYAIVEKSHGDIAVRSRVGEGTTFEIALPLTERMPIEVSPVDDVAAMPSGGETVLVVDDSAPVRTVVCRMLRKQGYEVLSAGSGLEALRQVQDYQSEIWLLLADVVMPGMSGPEVAFKIRELRPDIKVLFMSGHTGDEVRSEALRDLDAGFIQKPFKLSQLLSHVRM